MLVGTLKNIATFFIILILLPFVPLIVHGLKKMFSSHFDPRAQVGVICIKETLYDSSTITKHLHTFFKDPAIKAILLRIDSPGTAAGTAEALYNEIVLLKQEYFKPIVTITENICASGAYFIACATDHIVSSPSAIIGSIGTCSPILNVQLNDFIEQFKIHYAPLTAGTYKPITDPLANRTPAQTALLKEMLHDSYMNFAATVAKARKLSLSHLDQWADGKVFTGNQALKLGLIDQLGSATTITQVIKEKALIEGDINWVTTPGNVSWISKLFGHTCDDSESFFAHITHAICNTLEARYAQHGLH